jgi:hypothetical protein
METFRTALGRLLADIVEQGSDEWRRPTDLYFDRVWIAMAQDGHCAPYGSMEFFRVRAEWLDAGCPRTVIDFIQANANRPPMQRGG